MKKTIFIPLRPDEKGYLDRACPDPRCQYTFKVLKNDWEEKVSDAEVHCPMCGHVDTSDKWCTQGQLEQARIIAIRQVKSWAQNYIMGELDKSFGRLARSTRNNPFFRITYTPGRKVTFLNSPIGQMEQWETEICCEKCGTHYSVIGAAYFCPCCGHNSAVNSFNDSLDSIKKMLESLGDMKAMLTKKYGRDAAETMCRSLLESSIGDIVSAFQKFASCQYDALTGTTSRVNDFQIVEKGSKLFEKATGKKYADWLSSAELDFMNMMCQRRHLLEHNNGMVDQTYLDKSNDTSYSIGQRIVVKRTDAYALLDIVRKLGNELMGIQARSKSDGNQ